MNPLRMSYRKGEGWYLDVKEVLPDIALKQACDFAYKINLDRYRGLPLGDKKDELREALNDLKQYKARQRVIAKQNEEITLLRGV
jgi:hypothetical protein